MELPWTKLRQGKANGAPSMSGKKARLMVTIRNE
jgi:hypothetical protein